MSRQSATPGHFYLWLIPPAAVRERFAALIGELSRRLGTSGFSPHLTLAGPFDLPERKVVSRTAALAADLTPIRVHLTEVGWTEEYFRCFYVAAERSPELVSAHETACARFGRPANGSFSPHLSLIYGVLSLRQKERIADDIGRRFDTAFDANRVDLCRANGAPEQWRIERTFHLTETPARPDPT